ncbi:conjugative transfer signal peptidase TraF [Rhizobium sp. BK313]|uniref:conjugative transfer signal peptidase TraF n=1 Tax=Rhizobium sp. BK313 TaxID=2587081 RepID=UPI001061FEA5|nr:conjugative transfer signal peptidase TraF [Rhizobium sp. BK313]MBB3458824.1 conjugative transfer signal peptidase TraF [Rhizobium sp. BK313]
MKQDAGLRQTIRSRLRLGPISAIPVALGVMTLAAICGFAQLRINLTPSEPLGLWRIVALSRPVAVGDQVFVCPPRTATIAEGLSRGYLRPGLCPGGYTALIKTVVAIAGDRIEVGFNVRVNGREVAGSILRSIDGKGRPLLPSPSGTVPAEEVFLHSPYAASWDSRYFGPVPASGILGLAEEVWTYAP